MKLVNKFLPIIVVIGLCYWAIAPLLHPGFFPMHDDEQVGRLHELHLDVITGHLPPRLSQNLGYGYDYPLFNFYPSFVYYVAEIYHLLGFGYIVSIKLMIATGFILAAVGMYWLSRHYFGRLAGVISAFLYTYASYHSVDVYVRGALPEFWSFVFFPFIFLGFTKIAKKPKALWTIVTGVLMACFVLTHNLIALMSIPFVLGFLIYLLITTKKRKNFVYSVLSAGAIGVFLSAYFWLPALAEKQFTMVSLLTKELADYSLYFVYPIQFWYSPWGYGGSVAGMGDGLSFQIGKVYFLSITAVFVYAIFLLRKYKETASLLFLLIFLFLLSLFMQIATSKFVWDSLQSVMAYIQFPWRFLVISFFFASFAAGALFTAPFPIFKKKWVIYLQYLLGAVIIVVVLYKGITIFNPSKYLTDVTDNDYVSENVIRWDTSSLAFEYVPSGIATKKSVRGNTVVNITKEQIAKTPFTSISHDMNVKITKDIPQQKTALVTAETNGILQINVYSFPGWHVFLDSQEVSYSSNNALKLLRVPVSKGTHTISAVFKDTAARTIGNILSGITALGIIIFLITRIRRAK